MQHGIHRELTRLASAPVFKVIAAAGKGARPKPCRTGAGCAAGMEKDLAGGTAHLIHFDAGKDALRGETFVRMETSPAELCMSASLYMMAPLQRIAELSSRAIRC